MKTFFEWFNKYHKRFSSGYLLLRILGMKIPLCLYLVFAVGLASADDSVFQVIRQNKRNVNDEGMNIWQFMIDDGDAEEDELEANNENGPGIEPTKHPFQVNNL